MNLHECCCTTESTGSKRNTIAPSLTSAARWRAAAGSVMPAAGLALVPKCPACLAMYIALWTGVGISMSTAAYLRMLLIILCVASVVYFAIRQFQCMRVRQSGSEDAGHFPRLTDEGDR
jgi:hypothetical protein